VWALAARHKIIDGNFPKITINEEEIEEEGYDDSTNASDTPSVVSSKKSEDLKDRKPDDQDTMKTSRSAVNSLEGAL